MPTGKNSNSSSEKQHKINQGSKTGSGNSSSNKSGTSGQHATGSQSNKGEEGSSSSSIRGGTHEQHVEAGRQSHKNR